LPGAPERTQGEPTERFKPTYPYTEKLLKALNKYAQIPPSLQEAVEHFYSQNEPEKAA